MLTGMRLDTQPNGKLVVTSTSRFFDWLLFRALLYAIPTIPGALHTSFSMEESAPLIGTAMFLLGFVAAYERRRHSNTGSRSLFLLLCLTTVRTTTRWSFLTPLKNVEWPCSAG